MGWSDFGDGCYDGDGPADAVGTAMRAVAAESTRRTNALPSGEALLRAFLAALNLDGSLAPFYAEPRRIDAMVVKHHGRDARIDTNGAEPWMVAELHGMLDEVAEEYEVSWHRAPYLRELVHYLRHWVEHDAHEAIADDGWTLDAARFAFRKERKSRDRAEPPSAPSERQHVRVRHPKFGEGEVVDERGDRLTVRFADGDRVVMRAFLTTIVDVSD